MKSTVVPATPPPSILKSHRTVVVTSAMPSHMNLPSMGSSSQLSSITASILAPSSMETPSNSAASSKAPTPTPNAGITVVGRSSTEIHRHSVPYFKNLDHFRQIIGEGRVDRKTLKHWFDWSAKQTDQEEGKTPESRVTYPRTYKIHPPLDTFDVGSVALEQKRNYDEHKWEHNAERAGEQPWGKYAPVLVQMKYIKPVLKRHGSMPKFFSNDVDTKEKAVYVPPYDPLPVESVDNITRQVRILRELRQKSYDSDIVRNYTYEREQEKERKK